MDGRNSSIFPSISTNDSSNEPQGPRKQRPGTNFLYFLNILPFFGGPTRFKSFYDVDSILGPQKTGSTILFFIVIKTGCRGITQGRTPQKFVAKLDELMLNLSFHVTDRSKMLFSYLNQVICGFTAAQQSTSHKREILHAVLRS